MSPRVAWLSLWLCVAACSSGDASVAGDYTVTVTDRNNGCNLPNWTSGATSSATVTLTQSQNNVTAVVTGVAGVALGLGLGGNSFTGKVTGNDLDLHLFGTRSATSGNCTYTLNAAIRAVVSGDALSGPDRLHLRHQRQPRLQHDRQVRLVPGPQRDADGAVTAGRGPSPVRPARTGCP